MKNILVVNKKFYSKVGWGGSGNPIARPPAVASGEKAKIRGGGVGGKK